MVRYDDKEHRYFDGDKELISVTRLMQKHGLAPNYGAVPALVLEAAAQRGTLIHKEIDDYLTSGEFGFTKELNSFIEWQKNNLRFFVINHEFMIHNDIVAGRADLLLKEADGQYIIADFKTTSQIHYDSVSWQLSIYAYLSKIDDSSCLANYELIKGKVFHFRKDGSLEVIDVSLKPKEEIEKLFECERKGEIYKAPIIISNDVLTELEEVEQTIKYYENLKKEAEAKAQEMREAIIIAMEKNGLKSFENDHIRLTYVAPSERVSIDTTRLKNENPAIYLEYQRKTTTKASLRITLKED